MWPGRWEEAFFRSLDMQTSSARTNRHDFRVKEHQLQDRRAECKAAREHTPPKLHDLDVTVSQLVAGTPSLLGLAACRLHVRARAALSARAPLPHHAIHFGLHSVSLNWT